MSRPLQRFHGGIHPQERKERTRDSSIVTISPPEKITVILNQGIGGTNRPVVSVGDHVKRGERLSKCFNPISVPVHSPCDGVVSAIEKRPFPHPSGMNTLAIIIQRNEKDLTSSPNYHDTTVESSSRLQEIIGGLSLEELVSNIRTGGVIGLGGAGFPTAVKIRKGEQLPIKTLIINGMECEPCITCDDRLMRERPEEIIRGIEIIDHLLHPEEIMIGIEDNKPEAVQAMKAAAADSRSNIEVIAAPTLYPSGGEKQLIKILTGKEVPSGGLSYDISILCQNVATTYAIYHAALELPLTQRIVTVTGNGVERAGNYEIPLGTAVDDILQLCGVTDKDVQITVGGPMMGFPLHDSSSPITKTVNCLIVEKSTLLQPKPQQRSCIRCAACSDVCPAQLLPQQLYWAAQSRDFDQTEELNLFDCIECGCCNHVCPSHIPLVEYYRHAKGVLRTQQSEKQKADRARNRHEFRDARLLHEKEEKARKLAKKRAALKAKGKQSGSKGGDKKEAIRAAIERAKAKRRQREE
mgnify:CR=1 FL=1